MTIKSQTKKSIVWLGSITFVAFLCLAIAYGYSQKIYGLILPDMLNQHMSVTVSRNNQTFDPVGTPVMLGIQSKPLEGLTILTTSFVTLLLASLFIIRWWFEADGTVNAVDLNGVTIRSNGN